MGHLETEVKISVDEASLVEIRTRLSKLGAQPLAKRAKEENLLFDFPDHRLEREGYALRLRAYGEESLLTFKGKARTDSRLTVSEFQSSELFSETALSSQPGCPETAFYGLGRRHEVPT